MCVCEMLLAGCQSYGNLILVWFYDISTIIGYLRPNPFLYT